jgi:hypothetical protein
MEDALMTERRRTHASVRDATVWIDHDQAVIRKGGADDGFERFWREQAESESAFDLRTVHEIIDRDRIDVAGPIGARIGFERAYVSMTHRPDQLVAPEPTTPTPERAGGSV